MYSNYILLLSLFVELSNGEGARQRRYLVFTPATQFGVFATVSIALPEPDNLVNVAWFYEANYYNVDNATYFEPLLGDIDVSRSREEREASKRSDILNRSSLYTLIEAMLKKHGYPGEECLLRSICEGATSQFSHNGLLGDLIQLVLTPSASLSEDDVNDSYYEAEYHGLDNSCGAYFELCPSSPLDEVSIHCISILASGKSEQKRSLVFPPTSLYGTFLAIAVPIDIPDKSVFVSYNFESNYAALTNITEIDEVLFPNLPVLSSRQSRSITRELAYTVLETRFKEHGMNGRECMLRNICEAAETPLHHNGLLGHIMHIIFTPSSSREEGLDDEYYEAELEGQNGNCDKYLDDCPYSLFDIITRLVEIKH